MHDSTKQLEWNPISFQIRTYKVKDIKTFKLNKHQHWLKLQSYLQKSKMNDDIRQRIFICLIAA